MPTIIAFLIAGFFAAGFVTIWFATVYKELSLKRNILSDLREQLNLHERLCSQARAGPDEEIAAEMLRTSRMLWREAAKSYNHILRRPVNFVPGLLMGFRAAQTKNSTLQREE